MKQFDTFFRVGLTILILSIVLCSVITLASEQPNRQAQTARERAMNADQQLRDHNRQVAIETQKSKLYSTSSIPAEVTIKIDKNFHTASTIFFHDNMESGANGWTTTAYSGNDIWHQTTSDANSHPTSWWGGIEQQSNYNTGTRVNDALISPTINLSGAIGSIKLLFAEKYFTELGWDYCMVDVTVDAGAHWTHLRGGYGSAPCGDSYGWRLSSLDLTPYSNQNIQLRFYFDTGDSLFNNFPGWYVDDILVFDQGGLVTGKKFFDLNENHVKDIGERGIKDWLITATGQGFTLTTKTNYRGRYWLPLPIGSYTIAETQQSNWTQTSPIAGNWNIDITTPDTLVDSIHFGNYTHASFINGMKFHDLNQNGVYDPGDTVLPNWKILLTDTLGNLIDYDWTDSLGQYQLYIFQPGTYIVKEAPRRGWVQSYPQEGSYRIEILDLHTIINDKDFGNYYSPNTNAIMGQKFADVNRNHIKDQGEVGLAGFTIKLFQKGNGNNYHQYRQTTTDSSGYYQFLSVVPDTYKVFEMPRSPWWQSYPDSCYVVALNPGGSFDTLDFGNYQIIPGSIGGMKFNDLDTNGIKDAGESGLSGWTIMLSGVSVYGDGVSNSAITDQSGNYSFTGLWPGRYTVSEVWKPNWRQTYPTNLKPHFITLGPEENLTGRDFGNTTDNNFSLAFRTFLPESLALAVDKASQHKPIPVKPNMLEFWITLYNDTTLPAHSLIVHTTSSMDTATVSCSRLGTIQYLDGKLKKIKITFAAYVQPGDYVTIHGFSRKIGIQHASYQKWLLAGGGIYVGHHENFINSPRLPMPNAINLLSAGAGTNLRVGLGGPHSVVHPTYKDVMQSLIDKHGMHIGPPRCLDKFSGTSYRPIKNKQRNLPPTKHNNKLFAEAIALQANILGSDYGILPGGFGNLIFDEWTGSDPSHPMNGLPIRTIAARLDSFMSGYNDILKVRQSPPWFTGIDSVELYRIIRKIDSSFSGPIDTIQFGGGLRFKPVRPLSDVPFLHLDSSFIQMGSYALKPIPSSVPEQFMLYQNYPNPFNPSTIIEFYLPYQSFVTLKIYNTLGQEVATLLDKQIMNDGSQEVELSATTANLASGVYYYRIVAETITDEDNPVGQKFVSVKKMLMIK